MSGYICPMHPKVRQDDPGRCPKCGMNLVPDDGGQTGAHSHLHTSTGKTEPPPRDGRYNHVPESFNGTVFTCPMHPQVRETAMGSCPICGMGLEPETANLADEGPNPELTDFSRRMWVGAALTVPLLMVPPKFEAKKRAFDHDVAAATDKFARPSRFDKPERG